MYSHSTPVHTSKFGTLLQMLQFGSTVNNGLNMREPALLEILRLSETLETEMFGGIKLPYMYKIACCFLFFLFKGL